MESRTPPPHDAEKRSRRARSSALLATVRIVAISLLTLAMLLPYTAVSLASGRRSRDAVALRWAHRWVRWVGWLAGIRVRRLGGSPPPGALLAPNHFGYVDVIAVNSLTEAVFVAKAEVERWPVIGFLFRYVRQIGLRRESRRALQEINRRIAERLQRGESVCVFLEGTTTGGGRVLPFRPSLVQAAIDAEAPVVPVAIRWSATDDSIDVADDIAFWRDDQIFARHAWRFLGLRGITAEVTFGEPIAARGQARKELAEEVQRSVVELAGRAALSPPAR